MALRIGNSHLGDGVLLKHAAVDELNRIAPLAGQLIEIAGNHKRAADSGSRAQARQKLVERRRGREHAGSDVRHRLEARIAQPDRRLDRNPTAAGSGRR